MTNTTRINKSAAAQTKNSGLILVVDDAAPMRALLRETLASAGHRVAETDNGLAALEVCHRLQPDLILLDLQLPGINGIELCRRLKSDPRHEHIPVLMITSTDDETAIEESFKAGVADYITKPIRFAVLRQRIRYLLQAARAEQTIRFLAFHDALTGLPNRLLLIDRLEHAIERARRRGQSLAVLYADLDGFKSVNDQHGHAAGDELLKQVSARMTRALRQCDTIARVGGDEFIVILEEIHGTRAAHAMAEQLIRAIQVPMPLDESTVQVGCSIGIAAYPADGQTANDLIERADAAMYSAKTAGRNRSAFYEATAETIDEHSRMADELAYALNDGANLLLHYQPQRLLNAESPTVLEALVRWQHPRFGLLNAAAFIHIADEARLANKLDRWVISEVSRQLAAWKIAGMSVPVTTVNISEQSLRSPGVVDHVARMLAAHDIAADRLIVEISEHTAEKIDSPLEQVLQELRAIGVGLSIGDFGLGHCSIGTLARLPISGLKLSRNIAGMDQKAIETLVLSVIAIAKVRTLPVTATGIETETRLQDFRRLGCDSAQGHYLGKPMSADNLTTNRLLRRATA